jgi:hypothetical protein
MNGLVYVSGVILLALASKKLIVFWQKRRSQREIDKLNESYLKSRR